MNIPWKKIFTIGIAGAKLAKNTTIANILSTAISIVEDLKVPGVTGLQKAMTVKAKVIASVDETFAALGKKPVFDDEFQTLLDNAINANVALENKVQALLTK